MEHSVYVMKFGINTCYLIRGTSGIVMIDAGPPRNEKKFSRYLESFKISPRDIALIVLTHGDFDHAGSAGDLRALTEAAVVIHREDSDIIEHGIFNWPHGVTAWGKISRAMLIPLLRKMKLSKLKADVILGDEGMSLDPYGIAGKVIHTPGHTPGSISVILDTGEAFVGCLAHNFFLFTTKPKLPIYAQDIEQIKESWKTVIQLGATTIYPGHGNSFDVQKIRKYI